jgi:hemolysin III
MTTKPLLRGHFHQAAFFMACGACLMLIAKAQGTTPTIAVVIYSFSLIFLLGTSALYHRITWGADARKWMKKLDHSAIYILIAGTFTPICMLALSEDSGRNLLITIWSIALLGVLQSLFYVQAPKWLSAILYVIAGYMVMPYLSELKTSIGDLNIVMLIAGGVTYTVGAVTYALKKPNFNPEIFGYHEVFHLLVIVGAAFHFVLVDSLI